MEAHQQPDPLLEGDAVYGGELVTSADPCHPANLIPELCRQFYQLGWVTGTGGGISIRDGDSVYIAPSG
ncbi:Methylthioribulose-1-phosphate dehydratase, partial [Coemansia sp. RSA 2320]